MKSPLLRAEQRGQSYQHLPFCREWRAQREPLAEIIFGNPWVVFGKAAHVELVTFLGSCFVSVVVVLLLPGGLWIISELGGTLLLSWLFRLAGLSALGSLQLQIVLCAGCLSCYAVIYCHFHFEFQFPTIKRKRTLSPGIQTALGLS